MEKVKRDEKEESKSSRFKQKSKRNKMLVVYTVFESSQRGSHQWKIKINFKKNQNVNFGVKIPMRLFLNHFQTVCSSIITRIHWDKSLKHKNSSKGSETYISFLLNSFFRLLSQCDTVFWITAIYWFLPVSQCFQIT